MLGAIAGDIIGSRFEKDNNRSLDFELFHKDCRFTDDTVLTVAISEALHQGPPYKYAKYVKKYALRYPMAGYGGTFKKWMTGLISGPYNSWGNGSAMRVSPIGWRFNNLESVLLEAKKSATITHNHPEGVKGAQAVAAAVFMARNGSSKAEIKAYTTETFGYDLERKTEEIRKTYSFDVSCQGSVPESIIAFLESKNFEHAIRLAISIGGDSDTIAAMTGSIAEAYFGSVPEGIKQNVLSIIPNKFLPFLGC